MGIPPKEENESIRIARPRGLFTQHYPQGCSDSDLQRFYGWLERNRAHLVPVRSGDAYQHLKSDLYDLLEIVSDQDHSGGSQNR